MLPLELREQVQLSIRNIRRAGPASEISQDIGPLAFGQAANIGIQRRPGCGIGGQIDACGLINVGDAGNVLRMRNRKERNEERRNNQDSRQSAPPLGRCELADSLQTQPGSSRLCSAQGAAVCRS